MKKKVCVFTGTRAEYGLLKPLIDEMKKDDFFEVQVLVSGSHLSPEFGLTYQEIEKDGIKIDEKVEMILSADTPTAVCKSIGLGLIGYADALKRLEPDISIVLGDRFEALAFAIASYVNRIPIAHLHGGEITSGSIDEGFRHSITKLSYLHFVSTDVYRKRVIQMGEEPERVFVVGALGIDNIVRTKLLTREEIEKMLGFRFKRRNFLVTFHPETSEIGKTRKNFEELLKAIEEFIKNDNESFFIFTKANADYEGRIINAMIERFVEANKENTVCFASLGRVLYLSTMKQVDAIVGNSSSGIIEAPTFKIATINIGDRQSGRIKAESVVDCEPQKEKIVESFENVLSKEFRNKLKSVKNPYGDGNSAVKIINILKDIISKKLETPGVRKQFYDISF